MIDINALKNISKNTSEVIAANETKRNYTDTRFWKLERDQKTGNGAALIRFLPAIKVNTMPYVRVYKYFLKNEKNGKWYVEYSRRTIGEPDPMREYIYSQWEKATTDIEKQDLRSRFREDMKFIANVLVIKDPAHPENEGKVFLFEFGKKILDKIEAKTNSEWDDKCNIFDWESGANFKLTAKRIDKFVNYDSSEFCTPSKMSDEQILECANSMYDLGEFVDPKNFKSYEELAAKVNAVYKNGGATSSHTESTAEFESAPRTTVQKAKSTVSAESRTPPWDESKDVDDMLSKIDSLENI